MMQLFNSAIFITFLKVALIGLSSRFGRATSLLLKQSPLIKRLELYDENDISVVSDISVINTNCQVTAYKGQEQLSCALKDADIILLGEDSAEDEIKKTNEYSLQYISRVINYAKTVAHVAPNAVLIVSSNSINKLFPIVCRVLSDCGCFNCNKLLGCTSLDNSKANSLLSNYLKIDPQICFLPVIGGSTNNTKVPVFSQAFPKLSISTRTKAKLIAEIKNSTNRIIQLKNDSEALSKACATVKFIHSVIAGIQGQPDVAEICLHKTNSIPGIEYFALPVVLGKNGIEKYYGLPTLNNSEIAMTEKAILEMIKDAEIANNLYDTIAKKNVANEETEKDSVVVNNAVMSFVNSLRTNIKREIANFQRLKQVLEKTENVATNSNKLSDNSNNSNQLNIIHMNTEKNQRHLEIQKEASLINLQRLDDNLPKISGKSQPLIKTIDYKTHNENDGNHNCNLNYSKSQQNSLQPRTIIDTILETKVSKKSSSSDLINADTDDKILLKNPICQLKQPKILLKSKKMNTIKTDLLQVITNNENDTMKNQENKEKMNINETMKDFDLNRYMDDIFSRDETIRISKPETNLVPYKSDVKCLSLNVKSRAITRLDESDLSKEKNLIVMPQQSSSHYVSVIDSSIKINSSKSAYKKSLPSSAKGNGPSADNIGPASNSSKEKERVFLKNLKIDSKRKYVNKFYENGTKQVNSTVRKNNLEINRVQSKIKRKIKGPEKFVEMNQIRKYLQNQYRVNKIIRATEENLKNKENLKNDENSKNKENLKNDEDFKNDKNLKNKEKISLENNENIIKSKKLENNGGLIKKIHVPTIRENNNKSLIISSNSSNLTDNKNGEVVIAEHEKSNDILDSCQQAVTTKNHDITNDEPEKSNIKNDDDESLKSENDSSKVINSCKLKEFDTEKDKTIKSDGESVLQKKIDDISDQSQLFEEDINCQNERLNSNRGESNIKIKMPILKTLAANIKDEVVQHGKMNKILNFEDNEKKEVNDLEVLSNEMNQLESYGQNETSNSNRSESNRNIKIPILKILAANSKDKTVQHGKMNKTSNFEDNEKEEINNLDIPFNEMNQLESKKLISKKKSKTNTIGSRILRSKNNYLEKSSSKNQDTFETSKTNFDNEEVSCSNYSADQTCSQRFSQKSNTNKRKETSYLFNYILNDPKRIIKPPNNSMAQKKLIHSNFRAVQPSISVKYSNSLNLVKHRKSALMAVIGTAKKMEKSVKKDFQKFDSTKSLNCHVIRKLNEEQCNDTKNRNYFVPETYQPVSPYTRKF